jgi:hypothetical protein
MSRKKTLLLAMLALGGLVALFVTLGPLGGTSIAGPGVPDTPDARQIRATMSRAYELMGVAARTFDVSEFPTVFVDTPNYELSDRQREAINQILGSQTADQVKSKTVETAGYLTAMQAYYITWGESAARLETALKKAEAEKRTVTADEMQEIVEASSGRVPALARQDPVSETKLEFKSIEIDGDKATVRYDDGAALQEATLLKINGQWYISGIRPIWVHF